MQLLVLRGDDGKVRVFHNACPHRGTRLATAGRGTVERVQCPYHRWLFNTRGELLGAPGQEEFPATFRREDYGLKEMRSAILHGLVFVTCAADGPDLETFIGEAATSIGNVLNKGKLKLLGYQKVSFASNWKEYSDNEGYHAPLLHRAFRLLKFQAGKGVQYATAYGHKFIDAQVQKNPPAEFLSDPSLVEFKDPDEPPRSAIIVLYPLTLMVKHLDVINVRFAFPLSQHETEVHYAYFARDNDDDEMVRHRIRQASNLLGPSGFISLEDGAVFNRLHEGSTTPGTVAFQKGFSGPLQGPCSTGQNDEAINLVRWERYRKTMGFDRVQS